MFYSAVIMARAIARVRLVHVDDCRLSTKWLPTLRPSQMT